ncbi:MAG: Wzz/FepE/Etk N-terminal domain-containing protein [Verrucomicrobiia bacterium]
MNDRQTMNQRSRLTLDDVYYVLFKHKWKIITCSTVGLLGAVALVAFRPPIYESEAKLFIRYVLDSKSPSPTPDGSRMISSYDGQTVINSEIEILNSLDLAEQVVDTIGPEKILAKAGGGKDRIRAAEVVRKGLVVEVPNKSNVMRILFQHPDPDIVQPVLTGLIDSYFRKHVEIHQAFGVVDDFLSQETDQLRAQLAQTEEELHQARNKAGVISLEDSKKDYTDQIAKIRQEIFDAEAELAEHQATLKAITATAPGSTAPTNGEPAVASLPVDEYKSISTRVDELWKRQQELAAQFTDENTLVKGIRQQIAEAEQSKRTLEEKYPALTRLGVSVSNPSAPRAGTSVDVGTETTQVLAIQTKIKVLSGQLDQIRKEAGNMDQMDSTISELQRKKKLDEANYQYFSSSLEQARIDEAVNHGKISNISKIQAPSPPFRAPAGSPKKIAMIVAGGLALGLGWAFLIELFLDRSVKRPIDVQTKLRLPLFLAIPDVNRNGHRRLAKVDKDKLRALKTADSGAVPAPAVGGPSPDNGGHGIETWSPKLPLRPFYEALRDRLVMYFEVRGITHKPKLIAVTSAGRGAGVTTTAAGLAATLSETGDGNVLLVDMNQEQGSAQQFCQGRPVAKLEEALYKKDSALVQDKLYVVTETEAANGSKLPRILPKRFTNLVPKLKVSDYDYIIFDMPAITQTSVTPRLAGFMDMVLLVIESEKTDRQLVQQSCALLAESKANVSAVLNKTRTYVPPRLHQEFLSDS